MNSSQTNRSIERSQFNTLAQSSTRFQKKNNKTKVVVTGKGTDLSNSKALHGKAKKKTITQRLTMSLVDIADKQNNSNRKKTFWNTYHCQNRVISSEGRMFGKYCKNRYCTVCCSNRKAEILNKYLPVIATWDEPYFVTLTVKSVSAKILKERITRGMIRGFQFIVNRFKKRSMRGKSIKLVGIKSLECNFNPVKRTYNPHFHLIVPNRETAEILIEEWLKLWTPRLASKKGQNFSRIRNKEKALIEIVKYGSKIFTEPDLESKSKSKVSPYVYTKALYNILEAMKGHRIFERFGFNLPKSSPKLVNQRTLTEYKEWIFDSNHCDWVEIDGALVLSGYTPPHELKKLLDENIELELE